VRGRVCRPGGSFGSTFNATGDFDRLLPVPKDAFPVPARVEPHRDVVIPDTDLVAFSV